MEGECVFCRDSGRLVGDIDGMAKMSVDRTGSGGYLHVWDMQAGDYAFSVRFCPMCGSELRNGK